MIPNIGDIVYAFQDVNDRAGETMFLCSTQEHIITSHDLGLAEALENICEVTEQELIKGEWVDVVNPEKAKDLVVWEMKRIR